MLKILVAFIFVCFFGVFWSMPENFVYADSLDDILMNNETFENISECLECKLISPIFLSVSQFSYIVYSTFQTILIILLIFAASYWFLMFMWNKLKIDGERIDGLDFFKDIFKQMLKISISLIAIYSSPQFLLKFTVEPMMAASSFVTEKFINISRLATGNDNKIKFSDIKYNVTGDIKNKQALPDSMRSDLINIVENYSAIYKYGMTFGLNMLKVTIQEGLTYEALILLVKVGLKTVIEITLEFFGIPAAVTERVLNYIDRIATASHRVVGVIYLLVAIIGAMIFALYFLVSLKILTIITGFILNMGFAIILLPFAILSWGIKDMNIQFVNNLNMIGTVKTIFIGWISHLAMLSVILTFGTYILESLLSIDTVIAGQTISLKEYILLNSNYFITPLGERKIINIIWQNMDITLIFICFGWVMSYLIKNVPVYTSYFFEPVTNIDFSNKLWGIIKGTFGKVTNTTINMTQIINDDIKTIKSIMNSMDGNEVFINNTQLSIIKNIKQNIQNTSTLLKMYFNMPKDISRIHKYSHDLDIQSTAQQKENFRKINQFMRSKIKDISDKDNEIIKAYYNDKKQNKIKETYNNLSDNGKFVFINSLKNTLSDNDIENMARMIIAKQAEMKFSKDYTGSAKPNTNQYKKDLNKFIEQEIKKGIFLYKGAINNISSSKKTPVSQTDFINAFYQLNFDKNYLYYVNKNIDKWNKQNPFPNQNKSLKNTQDLLKIFKTINTSTESDKLIDVESEIRNIPKATVLNEQKIIIQTILDNLDTDYKDLPDKEKYFVRLLRKQIKEISGTIDNLNEEYDLEYDPIEERAKFYTKLLNNPVARKFIQSAHLDRIIKQLTNQLRNMDITDYDNLDNEIDIDDDDEEII